MENNFWKEIVVALFLVALLVALLNPFDILMPDMMLMATTAALVVVFGVFASFIWKERAQDEREGIHRMIAGRAAFLTGSAVLVLGIVVQSLNHALDVWLVAALVAMVVVKLVVRVRAEREQ